MRRFWIASLAAITLTGCGRTDPLPVLDASSQAFDPIAFFDGHVRSWGVMEARSGAPTGWVRTDCVGHVDGSERLQMVQHLSFQNDKPQNRIWTLWRTGPHSFAATANDMVGPAEGEVVGPAFHWQWVLAPDDSDRPFNVTMNQWMYRLGDGSVMIRTTVTKLGFTLAEISERFERDSGG